MRVLRVVPILLAAMLALVSCNRDPNVAKKRYLDSGNKYYDRAKYKEASIMYRNALQKDLRYGPAHYKLGLTYIHLSELAPAVQELRRAIELLPADSPDHWDAVIKLSEIYLAASPGRQYLEETDGFVKQLLKRDPNSFDGHRLSGDLAYVRSADMLRVAQRTEARTFLDQAIAEYRKADSLKPGDTGINMQLARSLAAEGNMADSEKLYRSLIDKNKGLEYAYTELYRLLMLSGKPDQAEQILKLGFQNLPKQYGFLTMLAAHYYNQHQRDNMVKVLEEIKTHSKDFPTAYLAVGDFYLRMGENDNALREFRDGMAKDARQKATYQKRVIEVLMRQGKREEASQVVADILRADPNDTDARSVSATLLLDKGDINRAMTELQSVVGRSPSNPVAHFNLGRAHEARNEWEQARQEFQRAVDIRPDYVLARLSLAQLQLQHREWDGAYRTAEQALNYDRSNINAQLIESAALMGENRFTESRAMLLEMLKRFPSSPDIHYQLGLVELGDRKYKEAEEAFRKSYQLNPGDSRGLLGVVETYIGENKSEDAVSMLQAEVAKQPNRPDLHLTLATAAVLDAKFDLAIEQFQTVLNSMPANTKARADVYVRLGETYRRKGDLPNAISSLEEARKILPDNPVVLSTLGLAFDGAGRRNEAQQAYQAALKADPNNGVALNNLAFLLADTGGDLDQALTYAQKAKQLLPNLAEVSDTLGLIYLRKNLSDDAVDIFKELVSKQPNTAIFHYHLGMAFSQKGDRPKALQELQQALKDNPTKEDKQKIQALMSRLG